MGIVNVLGVENQYHQRTAKVKHGNIVQLIVELQQINKRIKRNH